MLDIALKMPANNDAMTAKNVIEADINADINSGKKTIKRIIASTIIY